MRNFLAKLISRLPEVPVNVIPSTKQVLSLPTPPRHNPTDANNMNRLAGLKQYFGATKPISQSTKNSTEISKNLANIRRQYGQNSQIPLASGSVKSINSAGEVSTTSSTRPRVQLKSVRKSGLVTRRILPNRLRFLGPKALSLSVGGENCLVDAKSGYTLQLKNGRLQIGRVTFGESGREQMVFRDVLSVGKNVRLQKDVNGSVTTFEVNKLDAVLCNYLNEAGQTCTLGVSSHGEFKVYNEVDRAGARAARDNSHAQVELDRIMSSQDTVLSQR